MPICRSSRSGLSCTRIAIEDISSSSFFLGYFKHNSPAHRTCFVHKKPFFKAGDVEHVITIQGFDLLSWSELINANATVNFVPSIKIVNFVGNAIELSLRESTSPFYVCFCCQLSDHSLNYVKVSDSSWSSCDVPISKLSYHIIEKRSL